MASKPKSGHQGEVKDPEHDGRLKGHHGGEAKEAHSSHEGNESKGGKHEKARAEGGSQPKAESGAKGGSEAKGASGSEDLKGREYKDAEGNIHHHTKAYMEQHGSKKE